MGNELLSKQAVLEESFLDEEVDFRDSAVMSRRDAIRKMLTTAGVAAVAITIPIETLADEPVAADKAKEKKEAERKEIYDLVRKIGLYMIENKTPYTLKFIPQHDKNWNILKIRFQDEKSAIFIEKWFKGKGDTKPSIVDQYTLDSYLTLVDSYYNHGYDVIELY